MRTFSRFFSFFSGEDAFIIEKANIKTRIYFGFIGLFVLIIFALCFLSSDLFISNLFKDELVGFILSIVFALIFINLYLLILYTISPPLLPAKHINKTNGKTRRIDQHMSDKALYWGISLWLRVGILVLIGLFIAQPINVLIFSTAPDHEEYVKEIRDVLNNNQWSILSNIFICFLFLLPVVWKYMIRNNGNFYSFKKLIEHNLINGKYEIFRDTYSEILTEKVYGYKFKMADKIIKEYNLLEENSNKEYSKLKDLVERLKEPITIHKYEYHLDPPFRTIKPSSEKYLSQEDFIELIYKK